MLRAWCVSIVVEVWLAASASPECLFGEEYVQRLAVVGVDLAVQEDPETKRCSMLVGAARAWCLGVDAPILLEQNRLGRRHETRLGVVGRVEDFA